MSGSACPKVGRRTEHSAITRQNRSWSQLCRPRCRYGIGAFFFVGRARLGCALSGPRPRRGCSIVQVVNTHRRRTFPFTPCAPAALFPLGSVEKRPFPGLQQRSFRVKSCGISPAGVSSRGGSVRHVLSRIRVGVPWEMQVSTCLAVEPMRRQRSHR